MRHDNYGNSDHSFTTFVIGALAGVAAVIFLDKDVRTKVENRILEARMKGEAELEKAKEKVVETRDRVEEKAQEKLSQAQGKLEERRQSRGGNNFSQQENT